jgi:PQQ enzyme repeat
MLFNSRRGRWLTLSLGLLLLIWATSVSARSDPSESKPAPIVYNHFVYLPLIMRLSSSYDWLQFNGDPQHSGNNTQETILNASNVVSLTNLFQVSLPATADGAPVYLNSVSTISGTIDLIFVTTRAGHIVALNARTGAQVWSRSHPAAGGCMINHGSDTCYTTSSPVIDPTRQYVYSYGLDGAVHKHQVGDGSEMVTGGWPETVTLKPEDEKGSSALSFATANNGVTYLYMTNAGYPGDAGDYQGHVTAIKLSDGSQQVFNTMCSNQTVHFNYSSPDCAGRQTAIWARAGVVYVSDTNKIYMATGNGTFDPGSHYWGDTIFSLNPDGTGAGGNPLKTYTPVNYQALQNGDTDIGSTNIAILPTAITSTVQHLAVQGGKDAVLRLIDLDTMSGGGGPGLTGGEIFSTTVPQGGEILTAPAVWINPIDRTTWVFVGTGNGLSGLQLTYTVGHAPRLTTKWTIYTGGTSPLVANNVLYYASWNDMLALDPLTDTPLWDDSTYMGSIHWESPIVANGVLYITDQNGHLNAYALAP